MPKFNKDVFICAAEAVDSGHEDFTFSCNALYFVASRSTWLCALRERGITPVRVRDRNWGLKYENSYGELMRYSSDRITTSDIREVNGGDLATMREHRVLMLLLAGEILGGKEIE